MTKDPYLLTPGPLTTAMETKQAMGHDVGSRDADFTATNARIRTRLLDIAGAAATHVCVPMQGSGTFAVEAAIGTLIPLGSKTLILMNGAYGQRMAKIMDVLGRAYVTLETSEDTPPDANDVDAILAADADIGHVLMVHCETTSGILNPVADIADVVAGHGRLLLIDAMSSFGALDLSAHDVHFDAVMASANKCLEGVPGLGFVIVRRTLLDVCQGNAHSLVLDLFDQFQAMEETGQWRFTPPTHVINAFDAALDLLDAEGGQQARKARYTNNCRVLVDGMREFGFKTLLDDDLQAPIIVTFHMPDADAFDFQTFYDGLKDKGYVIYPGKLTEAPSFRIGCIGALGETEIRGALDAVAETLTQMGVSL
ncbi:MAG: 2-aminoethylphosphonate--pyruvate transaminase [Alphaproteobacteria bacterium]